MTQKYPVQYHTKGTKCKNSEILNVYTRLFIFICKLYWIYSHYVNSITPSVGAITCWQSILPLPPHTHTNTHTHLSSVTDVIQSSLGVVTVDHMLCDCFSFTEGFTSCCHANAACGFGTYGSNKKPILPSEIVSFRSVTPETRRRIPKEDPSVSVWSTAHWNIIAMKVGMMGLIAMDTGLSLINGGAATARSLWCKFFFKN